MKSTSPPSGACRWGAVEVVVVLGRAFLQPPRVGDAVDLALGARQIYDRVGQAVGQQHVDGCVGRARGSVDHRRATLVARSEDRGGGEDRGVVAQKAPGGGTTDVVTGDVHPVGVHAISFRRTANPLPPRRGRPAGTTTGRPRRSSGRSVAARCSRAPRPGAAAAFPHRACPRRAPRRAGRGSARRAVARTAGGR